MTFPTPIPNGSNRRAAKAPPSGAGGARPVSVKRFTMTELLVSLAIIVVLFAVSFTGIDQARRQAAVVGCVANQRHLAQAFRLYHNDQRAWPRPANWLDDLRPIEQYLKHLRLVNCPGNPAAGAVTSEQLDGETSYLVNTGLFADLEPNGHADNGHGNSPYGFDPSNRGRQTQLMLEAKRGSEMRLYDSRLTFHGKLVTTSLRDGSYRARTDRVSFWMLDAERRIIWDVDDGGNGSPGNGNGRGNGRGQH